MNTQILDGTHLIPFIDLTSLNDDDDETTIHDLCQKAVTPYGNVAAICIYPKFALLAHELLKNTTIPIATVINFPHPNLSITDTLRETEKALIDGANEIDLVFPYHLYIQGEKDQALDYVVKVKALCQYHKLKIIIETGELKTPELIQTISRDVIQAGANFVKTSTGKTNQGATMEAANIILNTIKEQTINNNKHNIGIKVAGGIRTIAAAQSYLTLGCKIMEKKWLHPSVFRMGASKLLDEILANNECF